jgi:uncharacterized protein
MVIRSIAMSLVVSLLGLGLARAAPPARPGPEGIWLGALDAGPVKLRLAFHIERGADGALHATLDSLDQGARGIPVAKVSYQPPRLHLELAQPSAQFDGTLAGDTLTGTWTQGQPVPLVMARVDKLEEAKRPQTPTRPFPYREEEVAITVHATPLDPASPAPITLAGTLTVPPGDGPFPAVVFITGSGPQDRDETLFGHKPFLVLSDALTRRGIATLRVDDRGVGKSTGSAARATTLDFAEDVAAELAWLAARPEIDKRAIGVIGHSEGALIGPIVASRSERVRFVVMLAGTGMPGAQILMAQRALISRADGVSEAKIARERTQGEALYRALRVARTDAQMDAAIATYIAADPEHQAQAALISKMLRTPWMRTFLRLDPIPYLEKVHVPVLALAGALDLQVPKDNLPRIEAALRRAKNPDVTTRLLPGLNHLFQHTQTGAPEEYRTNEETFAPEAIQLVCDWVAARAARLRR